MIAGRYRAFGGLRLLLALLVTVQHFQYLLPEAGRAPFHALGLGVTAVAVFFIISGFIVAEAQASFYQARPGAFLLNRLLRVVPPYLAALAVSVAGHQVLWQQGVLRVWDFSFAGAPLDPRLILGSVTALLPLPQHPGAVEFIPFVWSLRIELAFYLAVCLVCLAWPGAARAFGAARARRLLVHLCFAAGFGLYGILLLAGGPLVLQDIPFFLAGVAIFRLRQQPDRWLLFAVAAIACCWSMRSWPQPPGLVANAQAAIFVMLAAMFMLAGRLRLKPSWCQLGRELGSLSYPLYLNHYIVGISLFDITTLRGWPLLAAGVLLSLVLAAVMHRLVEAPLCGFRNGVRGAAL
jgi:peptidoglycan/LPS O-acetylase OafA/YrhL